MRQMVSCAVSYTALAFIWYYQMQPTTETQQTAAPMTLEDERPLYWVVAQPSYPPFSERNEEGLMTGLDVDLLMAIAQKEGIDISIRPIDMKDLFKALDDGEADIVLSGIGITPERVKQYGFTQPYLRSQWAVLSKKQYPAIKTNQAMANKKIAVIQKGTAAYQLAKIQPTAHSLQQDRIYSGVQNIKNNHADMVFDVLPVLQRYADNDIRVTPIKSMGKVEMGFALRKDNVVLKQKLNHGLTAIKKDGTYDRILEKWGLENK